MSERRQGIYESFELVTLIPYLVNIEVILANLKEVVDKTFPTVAMPKNFKSALNLVMTTAIEIFV